MVIYRRYVEAPRSHPRQGAPPRFRPTVGPTTPATAARAPTTRKPRSRRDRTRPSGGACRYAPPSASIRAACPLRRLARRVSSLRGTRALPRTSSLATRTAGLRPHVARPLIWRVENQCVIGRFANPADLWHKGLDLWQTRLEANEPRLTSYFLEEIFTHFSKAAAFSAVKEICC